ncbi:hypothetical protein LEMLEM_LOCUS20447 [Lemmus lemmus]
MTEPESSGGAYTTRRNQQLKQERGSTDVGRAQIAKAILCRKNKAQRGCNIGPQSVQQSHSDNTSMILATNQTRPVE